MNKYLLFSFSFLFMPFFLTSLVVIFFFICHSPSFSFSFIFFLLELSCFFSSSFLLSGGLVSTVVFPLLPFFFLGAPHFVFLVFGFFLLFLFLWGPCVFSLFFHLNKPFEIYPMFLAVSLIVSLIHVDPVRNHAMNDISSPRHQIIYM